MNKIILFLLISIALLACKNQKKATEAVVNTEAIYSLKDAFGFQSDAMKSYNTDPKSAAVSFSKAAIAYIQNGYNKDAGICYGNLAHIYEEQFNNIDSALIISKLCLEYAIKANDTLNTGHGYRYTGYLNGMKNNLDEGVTQIEKSKPFYTLRNNKDAIAVADYDLARIYTHAKQYDKAIKSFNASTDHFKNKMNLQRIFNNNLFALKMYKESGNKAAYEVVKSENENLIQTGKISDAQKALYQKALSN
jgi:hypothetical protein